MASASRLLNFDTSFNPRTGEPVQVAPLVVRLTAPNDGPFTYTGTNSFIIGGSSVAVVDPGPDDGAHFAALLATIAGRPVEAILLTHTHKDHSALAPRLKVATGAPLWLEGEHRPSRPPRPFEIDWVKGDSDYGLLPDRRLRDGETFSAGGVPLEAIATPGHCANHLCFGLAGTPWMLSGDHVMGWNSTMIAVPDGSMEAYLASLEHVTALPYRHYLPAHGGPIMEGPDFAAALRQHRLFRNEEIVGAVRDGSRSLGDLQRAIYPKLAPTLMPAAQMTLRAHIEFLAARGRITARFGAFGVPLEPA